MIEPEAEIARRLMRSAIEVERLVSVTRADRHHQEIWRTCR